MSIEDSNIAEFVSEVEELLEEMEQALLQAESDPNNPEIIAAVFRAAHTIKGTSGIFSFDEVTGFTHVMESLLDKVRNGDVSIDSKLIALFLVCKDHIEKLVDAEVAGGGVSDELNSKNINLIRSLESYLGDEYHETESDNLTVKPSEAKELQVPDNDSDKVSTLENEIVSNDNWHISIQFSENVLRFGMDPLSFLRYLSKLGDIVDVALRLKKDVEFDTMDPEGCYVGLEIELKADTSKKAIEKVFEFVKDECKLVILPPRANINEYIDLIDSLISEDEKIGEILVKCGALTEFELEQALSFQSQQDIAASGEVKPPLFGEVVVNNRMAHKEVVDAAVEKQKHVQASKSGTRSIRIDAEKLDQLVNLVGEMVIAGASTNLIANSLGNDALTESMSVMSRLVEEIRDSALRLRMVQIGETFSRFKRVVRDVSQELNKNIVLDINGGDTELDKTVVEKIGDPLMHLVRNAMDHGLESNSERLEAGKSEFGTVSLNAYHDSGSIVIEVQDDGRGLDAKKILAKAKEKGIVADEQHLTDQEIYHLIFEPGFSTAAQVTNLSGRGVGMDVVRKNIEALRGSVDIESEFGIGSIIRIRLPLTLAIIDGFLVGVGSSSYVIPLDMIHECVEINDEINNSLKRKTQGHINLRGEVLPLLYLRDHFKLNEKINGRENIVVVQFGNLKIGLVVDQLLGEFQTVIKPLGKIFNRLKGVSGSTILGSGEVAVILDVPGLITQASSGLARNTQSANSTLH